MQTDEKREFGGFLEYFWFGYNDDCRICLGIIVERGGLPGRIPCPDNKVDLPGVTYASSVLG
jgi:hypothetical protein